MNNTIQKLTFFFIKYFSLILLLSGCSTYAQLNKLTPHYLSTQQGQIEYYHSGKGTPIILIAGYATDVSSWDQEFLATLAQQHHIIIPNNRNVGGSKTLSTSYQSDDLANDMYDLIQKLRLKKPAVIGISMGGMIAQKLAVLHPNTLGQLILINTTIAGNQTIPPTPDVQEKLLHLSKHKIGLYLTAIDLFSPPEWKARMAYSLIADRFQPKKITATDSRLVIPMQQKLIISWLDDSATAKKLNELQLPVLILNGESDVVIPPINSIILAHNIPHAQVIRWKEGGHAMIYQYPKEIGNAINNFIEKSHENSPVLSK